MHGRQHALDDGVSSLQVGPDADAEEDFVAVDASGGGVEVDAGWRRISSDRGDRRTKGNFEKKRGNKRGNAEDLQRSTPPMRTMVLPMRYQGM